MRQYLRIIPVLFVFCFLGLNNCTTNRKIPVPKVSLNDPAIVPAGRSTEWWVKRHENRIGENVIQNQYIIFIGDSIMQGWEGTGAWKELNQKFNNRITNLGFSSDQTQHVIWRLLNGEFPAGINPKYVVLMIGTNNKHDPKSTAAGIGKIIKIISITSPFTEIILVSLLPYGSGNDDEGTVRNNEVNKIIKKYDGHLQVKYLDLGQYYTDSDGALKEELFTDKLHLSSKGYNLWKEKLLEIIE